MAGRLWLALLACLSLASLWIAASSGLADLQSMAVRAQLGQMAQTGQVPTPAQWKESTKALAGALAWSADPVLLENQAYLYEVRARQVAAFPEVAKALQKKAADALESALALRPMAAGDWSRLAVLRRQIGADEQAFLAAYDRAWRYGRREQGVQMNLAEAGFANWQALGIARQDELRQMLATASPALQPALQRLAATAAENGAAQ